MIYLLHATRPLVRTSGTEVCHYLGFCDDDRLETRLAEHRTGHSGAKIIRAYLEHGADLVLVRTWPHGGRALERYLKSMGHLSQHCPICRNKHLKNRRLANQRAAKALSHQLELPSARQPQTSGGGLPVHNWIPPRTPDGRVHPDPHLVYSTPYGVPNGAPAYRGGEHSIATALPYAPGSMWCATTKRWCSCGLRASQGCPSAQRTDRQT